MMHAAAAAVAAGTVALPLPARAAAGNAPAAAKRAYEQFGPARAPHTPIRLLDTVDMPIEAPAVATGWGTKTLFGGPGGEHLRILYVPPGAEGAKVHYHEWAYNLAGDFTNNESTMPDEIPKKAAVSPLRGCVADPNT